MTERMVPGRPASIRQGCHTAASILAELRALANPVARRLFGALPQDPERDGALVWQPPEPLRQPLADVLQNQREYLPEGFETVPMMTHRPAQESPRRNRRRVRTPWPVAPLGA